MASPVFIRVKTKKRHRNPREGLEMPPVHDGDARCVVRKRSLRRAVSLPEYVAAAHLPSTTKKQPPRGAGPLGGSRMKQSASRRAQSAVATKL